MRPVACAALAAVFSGFVAVPIAAQGRWVSPQPPCELSPGQAKINGGVRALKDALEKPDRPDQQLARARQALTEAILQDRQDQNPAAWYYLGRSYVALSDAAGADTAFARALALAPGCAEDIAGYRRQLWTKIVNDGFAAWQDGKEDSGLAMFRLAARLDRANPKPLGALAGWYASKNNDDSALAYYRRAAEGAGSDTTFARDKKEALSNAWRLLVRRVQGHPAAPAVPRLRARLDSIDRRLPDDSAVLAKLIASSQSRRARRRQLAPADQKLFTRDSTARSQAVAQARASRAATLTELAESDRVLQTAFAAAIAALKEYLAVYPDAVEAAVALAALLGQSNRLAESAAVFDSLSAHAKGLDPAELLAAGERFVGQGLYRPGVRALAIGLERNPYRREALYSLAVGYYELRDSTNLLPAAQRLLALDPLSRSVLKLVAAGWDFRGRSDSAAAYVTRAGFDLAVEVTVPAFLSDSTGASLTAFATNLKPAASKPFRLTVEFLDARGRVVATASHDVPTIPARQSFKVDLKVSGPGIAGWRYRAS